LERLATREAENVALERPPMIAYVRPRRSTKNRPFFGNSIATLGQGKARGRDWLDFIQGITRLPGGQKDSAQKALCLGRLNPKRALGAGRVFRFVVDVRL